MNSRSLNGQRHISLVALATTSLLSAAPAFAAAFELPYSSRDLLLYGSIALLVVGIALRIFTHRDEGDAAPREPDLRWWRNVEGI